MAEIASYLLLTTTCIKTGFYLEPWQNLVQEGKTSQQITKARFGHNINSRSGFLPESIPAMPE